MSGHDRREHRRVRDAQTLDTVHLQQRVDDAPVLERGHSRAARGVVQCLRGIAYKVLELGVGALREVVV